MESKNDYDILKGVTDTITKWYKETCEAVKAKKPASSLDVELFGILLAARKQTLGVLATLAEKHILPTQVLLRVLVEIHVVLLWA